VFFFFFLKKKKSFIFSWDGPGGREGRECGGH